MDGTFILCNGIKMPDLCFGGGIVHTYKHTDEPAIKYLKYRLYTVVKNKKQYYLDTRFRKSVKIAMENGLYMFDTSKAYKDAEHELGLSLEKYNRNDYFIISKLCNSDQYKGDVRSALISSLKALKIDQLDLYLMHWPVEDIWKSNWKQMEKLYEEGLCKAIGVCNCNIHHLKELEITANIMPMVNQFECHPLFTQDELRHFCKENNIQVMAYTPTARMDERLKKTVLSPIAQKYGKSITQIMLRWHQQVGNIPIFHSTEPKHIISNIDIKDFSLDSREVEQISSININSRLRYDPDNCDFRQL